MLFQIHRVAAILALFCIVSFWISTVVVEIRGDVNDIALVKHAILWGLLLLIPALIVTNATGYRLGRHFPAEVVRRKLRRAVVAALNGVLVLVPAAFYLDHLAQRGDFGTGFIGVQALELLAGGVNIALLVANARAGYRLHNGSRG